MPFASLKELADRIARPPHNWTIDTVWHAYEAVEAGTVRHNDKARLTDLVSLLRYTFGADDELVPYADKVHQRYANWLAQQQQSGVAYSPVERWWLDRMAEVIASSATLTDGDLDAAPFTEKGGIDGALRDLGPKTGALITQLNRELTA